jgi:hypothetical protein
MKKIILLLMTLCVVGCGTTKGYRGAVLPDEELAIIYQPDNVMFSTTRPAAYIGTVNNIEVGNFTKGYASFVEVKPGNIDLILNLTWPSLKRGVAFASGGAVGGAIDASSNHAANRKQFSAFVEKGKKYIVKFELVEGQQDIIAHIEEYTPKS